MSKYKRRKDYWKVYHIAHAKELAFLIAVIAALVYVSAATSHQGPSHVHSKVKLDCVCILMIVLNISLRDMESLLKVLKTPWDGDSVPDHSTVENHRDTIDEDWLQFVLAKTAQMCMETAGWTSGYTASDSSGVELDRYEAVVKDWRAKKQRSTSSTTPPQS